MDLVWPLMLVRVTASLEEERTHSQIKSHNDYNNYILANFAESFDSILHTVTESGLIFVVVHEFKLLNNILLLRGFPSLRLCLLGDSRSGLFNPL